MSDRKDFYYRQKVIEGELDGAFDDLERADRAMVGDLAFGGIASGGAVVQHSPAPDLTVDVSACTAYDPAGQRIRVPSTQTVDVSQDSGGVTTTVATPGNAKIVSVFLKFARLLSDPRVDGNGDSVNFSRAESFSFFVKQGAEAVSGAEVPPSLESDGLLLADITRTNGVTAILNAAISTSRRGDSLVLSGSPRAIRQGQIRAALTDLLGFYNAHVNGSADQHSGGALGVSIASTWADASGVSATDVDGAFEEVVTDLASATGAAKVGSDAVAGTFLALSGTSIATALSELAAYANAGPAGRSVANVSGNTTLSTQRVVNVDTSGGAVSLTLPAPVAGREFMIKDTKGTFGTNACTLVRAGAEKIEGVAASRVLSASWGSYRVYSDGTDWFLG